LTRFHHVLPLAYPRLPLSPFSSVDSLIDHRLIMLTYYLYGPGQAALTIVELMLTTFSFFNRAITLFIHQLPLPFPFDLIFQKDGVNKTVSH
jgi:hypothetical protein